MFLFTKHQGITSKMSLKCEYFTNISLLITSLMLILLSLNTQTNFNRLTYICLFLFVTNYGINVLKNAREMKLFKALNYELINSKQFFQWHIMFNQPEILIHYDLLPYIDSLERKVYVIKYFFDLKKYGETTSLFSQMFNTILRTIESGNPIVPKELEEMEKSFFGRGFDENFEAVPTESMSLHLINSNHFSINSNTNSSDYSKSFNVPGSIDLDLKALSVARNNLNLKYISKETYISCLFKWLKDIEEEIVVQKDKSDFETEDFDTNIGEEYLSCLNRMSNHFNFPFYSLISTFDWMKLIPQGFISTFAQFIYKIHCDHNRQVQMPQLQKQLQMQLQMQMQNQIQMIQDEASEKNRIFTQIHLLGLLTSPFDPNAYLKFSSFLSKTINNKQPNETSAFLNSKYHSENIFKRSQIKLLNSMSQAHQEKHNAFSSLYVLSFDAQCVINDDLEILDFNSAFPETFRISNDDQNRRLTFQDFCVNSAKNTLANQLNRDSDYTLSSFRNKVAQSKILGINEFDFILMKSNGVVFLANIAIISLVDKLPLVLNFKNNVSKLQNRKQRSDILGLPSIAFSTAGKKYSSIARRYKAKPFSNEKGPKFQLVIRDITDLRKSELHLKQVSRLYRLLWNSIQTPLVICLESGLINYCNLGFSKLVQLTLSLIVGKHIHDFFPSKTAKENFIKDNIITKSWKVSEVMVVKTDIKTQNTDQSTMNVRNVGDRQFRVSLSLGSLELSNISYYVMLLTNIEEITVSPHLAGFKERVEKFLKYCRKPSLVFKYEIENTRQYTFFSNVGANLEFVDMLTVKPNRRLLQHFTLNSFFIEIKSQIHEALKHEIVLVNYEKEIWFTMIQHLKGKYFCTKIVVKNEISRAVVLISELPFGSNVYLLEVFAASEFSNISFVDSAKHILSALSDSLYSTSRRHDLDISLNKIIKHVGSLLSISSSTSSVLSPSKENLYARYNQTQLLSIQPSKVTLTNSNSSLPGMFFSDDDVLGSFLSSNLSTHQSSKNLNSNSKETISSDTNSKNQKQHSNSSPETASEILRIESELNSRLKDVDLTTTSSVFFGNEYDANLQLSALESDSDTAELLSFFETPDSSDSKMPYGTLNTNTVSDFSESPLHVKIDKEKKENINIQNKEISDAYSEFEVSLVNSQIDEENTNDQNEEISDTSSKFEVSLINSEIDQNEDLLDTSSEFEVSLVNSEIDEE
eukprot:TRINITY_DN2735_c0_g2_i1.p1 TRINITY_DN2735_c0_g2~~TRINITY_DN2735_c0_g2_i1.p1  ORF type:complete len:1250 (+),score=327.45 TRINITY_DN2735_c0_g2_i1:134-3751(+)